MKLHQLIQGTTEWLAYRANHFNASDAPAMMNCSPYKTRAALLRELHTGLSAEVDAHTRRRYDAGHRFEGLARPLAEAIVGEDFYPVVGSEGRLSASFDGLTLDGSTAFEHKTLNAELARIIPAAFGPPMTEQLPLHYRVQMEQQCLVSACTRVLFIASNWHADGNLIEERHCWYEPDYALRDRILDGWLQFDADLAAYVPTAPVEAGPVGKAPDTLPALRIEVTGMVTASNLDAFKATALEAIRGVNRELSTDADFADAEKAVKWCSDVEARLAAAKEHALSQTASIDALFKAIDDISAEARRVRLDLDRLVTRRKQEVKEAAVAKARKLLDLHIATLNAEIAPLRVAPPVADFAGAIKGKRTMASVQNALDDEFVKARYAADASARLIRANVTAFKERAAELEFLFADLGHLVHKEADDFGAVLSQRIAAHRVAEEARESARKKLEAEAEAKRKADELATKEADWARMGVAAEAAAAAQAEATAVTAQAQQYAPQPQSNLLPVHNPSPRTSEPATLNLGEICGRLGFVVTAAFVTDALHVKAAGLSQRKTPLYSEPQFRLICAQLQSHISAMAELYEGEAA